MIGIEVNAKQLTALREAVSKSKKSFGKELAKTVNKVAKQTVKELSSAKTGIPQHINIKPTDVKKLITVKPRATESNPVAEFSIAWTKRPGLQYFGAKQNSGGVNYRMSKKGKSTFIAGAFMGPRPGVLAPSLNGGVFIRRGEKRKMTKGRYQGKVKQPIVKLRGASVAGVFVKNKMDEPTTAFIKTQLDKEMARAIRENVLRANGLIPK